MHRLVLAVSVAAACSMLAPAADAGKRTVCTITVNSTDEREAFRRHLPEKDFTFVELVEHGRRDWLASACKQQVKCDVLVISGHFNGSDFFSDQLQISEHLPVAEMERASCSGSCPGVFANLKEVYMFGCDSLNGERMKGMAADIAKTLVNGGQPRAEAERVASTLIDAHAESNRDVMRRVFVGTPAIYGFSSVAPVGATAGPVLHRALQVTPAQNVGSGRVNQKLLSHFAAHAMAMTPGMGSNDPRAAHRTEVCRFVDDRLQPAQKLAFVHSILQREPARARVFLDRIERFMTSLTDDEKRSPAVREALATIGTDATSRDRYLGFARNADAAATRIRMTALAHSFGWLSEAGLREENVRILNDLVSSQRATNVADIDQACRLNRDGSYDGAVDARADGPAKTMAQAAVLACLGNTDDRGRLLHALASANERDVEIAEVYFHHRPIAESEELRAVTGSIARLARTDAQVRALHALARQPVSDAGALDELARMFPVAETVVLQRAIANVFIRSDHRAIATPELVRVFRDHRKAGGGADVIDVLIRRLERSMVTSGAQARR